MLKLLPQRNLMHRDRLTLDEDQFNMKNFEPDPTYEFPKYESNNK